MVKIYEAFRRTQSLSISRAEMLALKNIKLVELDIDYLNRFSQIYDIPKIKCNVYSVWLEKS